MRCILLAVVAVLLCASPAHSGPKTKFAWKHEGYKSLRAAAAEAQTVKKRLLVGLSGSFT